MTSCQNICEVEECPGGGKGLGGVIPFGNSFSGPRGALTDVTAASKWFGSKFSKVSWRDPLSPWHVLASTQVGLLPTCNPAQYSVWWASSEFDKVDKTLSGLFSLVTARVDVFLGSSSPFSCQRCTVKVRLSSADLAEKPHACEGLGTSEEWRDPARIWACIPVTQTCTFSAMVARGFNLPTTRAA